jgi:DNA-binding XRE family transcriptional regulator
MIVRPRPIAQTGDTVTYSRRELDRFFEQLEDLEALAAYAATRDEENLPAEVVQRLCSGESAVRVFREHRGLSLSELAVRTGLSSQHLVALETGGKRASAKAVRAVAAALGVTVDDLLP